MVPTFAYILLFWIQIVLSQAPANPPYEIVSVNVTQPTNNAPLNQHLANYRFNATNGKSTILDHDFVDVSCGARLSVHYTNPGVFPDAGTKNRPILLLNHGYPETAYIWRKLTKELSKRVPLMVVDRPGYGLSSSCTNRIDQRSYASAILEATSKIFGKGCSVILAGHDRGARSMHRAAVDIGQGKFSYVKAVGLFLADIVPVVAEYNSFSNPDLVTGYFHWAFMPRTQGNFSLNVIMAYGGGNWVDYINHAGAGLNEEAKALFMADQAFETYHTFFDQLSVTNASIWDYASAKDTDYAEMLADQKENRKIKIPTHIEYSKYNLETLSRFNVGEIWRDYVDKGVDLTWEGIGGQRGHFIVELAPTETIDQLNRFMDRLNVRPATESSVKQEL